MTKGTRGLTPALTLAFAIWVVMACMRLVFMLSSKEPWAAIRFNLISEGTGFAAQTLALLGSFELARRLTGQAARGIKVAAWGFVGVVAFDTLFGLFQLMDKPWEHTTLTKVADYGYWLGWQTVMVGLAIAHWRHRRTLAILIVAISLLTWPPAFLAKDMYGWMPDGKTGFVIEMALRFVRLLFALSGFFLIEKGAAIPDHALAASGLRTSAKAQWLRLVAALVVPLLTLMVIGSRAKSGMEMVKLATIAAQVVNIVALTLFGIGALRTARAAISELGSWVFALGAVASWWASGVMFAQLSWLYKMLYGNDSGFGGSQMREYAQTLAVAMPIVVIAGMGLLAVAISGFAARRGNEELRGQAQAKGAGFVTLSLVALAISGWMLQEAKSLGSAAMLILLAAGAGLAAIAMLAKLLNLAADALEQEPGLPHASVVSDGT